MKKETRQPKKLPALMDGKTMILPAGSLPPPDGDTEQWWEEIARPILLPRWAAECIRQGVVWGQDLRDGESMKERVETIMRTPGEIFKWERVFGLDSLEILFETKWKEWDGTLAGIYGRGADRWVDVDAKRKWWSYLEGWMRESVSVINGYALAEVAGDDCQKIRAAAVRLLAEGESELPGWEYDENEWPGDARPYRFFINKNLNELLSPPSERERSLRQIAGSAARAFFLFGHDEGQWWGGLLGEEKVEVEKAAAEARVAEAEARREEAEAEKYWARDEAKEARAARERAEAERKRAEEARREEEKARVRWETIAKQSGRMLDAWGPKLEETKAAAERAAVASGRAEERSAGAERAARSAEVAAKGLQREKKTAGDWVDTFRAFEEAKREAGAEADSEEIARDVLQKERDDNGRMGGISPKTLINRCNEWVKMGRPDATKYDLAGRGRKRKP